VPSSGIYYFNIGGTAFSTYVEAGNGWVLIASGSASTTEGAYTRTTSLTLQSDKILPASVYASSDIKKVRINATAGPNIPFDVETGDAQTLANLMSDATLSLNSDGSAWTGTGTSHMNKLYGCTSLDSLSIRIYHGCNNGNGLHWLMPGDIEKVSYSSGTENDLNLWVRANAAAFLPVELIDFKAERADKQVRLRWQTASEHNNEGFYLQRSSNSRHWETLAFLAGNGSSQAEHSYAFTDQLPLPGMNYYRLLQKDFDGQSAYSKVIGIELENSGGQVRLFPNPSEGGLHLSLDLDFIGNAIFTLYDCTGRPVKTLMLPVDGGTPTQEIDLGGLPAGIYLAKVQAGANTWQQRLVLK
jgi:hypothetical protein